MFSKSKILIYLMIIVLSSCGKDDRINDLFDLTVKSNSKLFQSNVCVSKSGNKFTVDDCYCEMINYRVDGDTCVYIINMKCEDEGIECDVYNPITSFGVNLKTKELEYYNYHSLKIDLNDSLNKIRY